jgi:hypothetical protein
MSDIAPKTDDFVAPVSPPAARQAIPRRWIWLGALGLIVAVALAYSNSFTVPFIFDDETSIPKNESIRSWRTMFFPPSGYGDTVEGRPMLNVSLAINYAISEENVWSYHLFNLLIHMGAGLALFGLVRRTLGRAKPPAEPRAVAHADSFGSARGFALPSAKDAGWGERDAFFCALAAAALWLLHPLQTQSVTYIVQRAESLMAMLYLLVLYCFARGTQFSVFSFQMELPLPLRLRAEARH